MSVEVKFAVKSFVASRADEVELMPLLGSRPASTQYTIHVLWDNLIGQRGARASHVC